MLLSWLQDAEVDWWYSRYATRWKLISSNVVLHRIGTCLFSYCSPVLTETKPATQHYKHVVRVTSQLTLGFPILHSASQYEQSCCCHETFVHGIYKTYNPWDDGQPCGLQLWLWKLLAKQPVCSIKLQLMKHNISSSQSPRQCSGFKAYVGQRVGR